jgi:membrane-associated phospholipid phosphatase
MRPGDTVTLVALFFLVVVGWLRRISPKQQRQITGLALLGTALIATTLSLSKHFPASAKAVGDWLPCLLLLIVYWQAGRFFGTPNEKLQAWLVEFDRRRLGRFLEYWAHKWNTTWIGTYFELAYLFCYALIPIGVGVLYWAKQRSAIDVYWATVLPASYLCYVIVPFAQTLPPRLLHCSENAPDTKQKIRSLNLFILRHASIHLNTFPSAHVASTVGASLVLMRFVPAVGVVFMLVALSIAAGAVVGRYHFALDVILGTMLAVCIAACFV